MHAPEQAACAKSKWHSAGLAASGPTDPWSCSCQNICMQHHLVTTLLTDRQGCWHMDSCVCCSFVERALSVEGWHCQTETLRAVQSAHRSCLQSMRSLPVKTQQYQSEALACTLLLQLELHWSTAVHDAESSRFTPACQRWTTVVVALHRCVTRASSNNA
jgi:hypothetical protein